MKKEILNLNGFFNINLNKKKDNFFFLNLKFI